MWTVVLVYGLVAVCVSVFLVALGCRLHDLREARRREDGVFVGDYWTREWERE